MDVKLLRNRGIDKYDYVLKIILVGDTFVGKTNILRKYLDEDVDFSKSTFTIGIDYKISYENINNSFIKNQLWDTAGQERFRSIIKSYFKSSDICLLCFDSTIDMDKKFNDKGSGEGSICNIMKWINILEDNLENNTMIWIIGTKIDILENNDMLKLKNNIREFIQYWRGNTNRVIKFAGWCSSKNNVFMEYDCDNIYFMTREVKEKKINDIFKLIIKNYIETKKKVFKTSLNIRIPKYEEENNNHNCCSIM